MPSLIDKIVNEAKAYNQSQAKRSEEGEPTLVGTAKRIGHAIVESHSQIADDIIDKVQEFRGVRKPKRKSVMELTPEEQAFAELYYYVGNTYEFRQILTGSQSVAELAQEVELRMDFFSFTGGYEALRNYRQTTKPLLSDRMEDIMNQVDEAKALKANIAMDKQRLSELEAAFIPNKKPQTAYSSMLEASIEFAQEQLDNAMEKGDGENIRRYHDSVTLMKSALDAYNGVTPQEPKQRKQNKKQFKKSYGKDYQNQPNRGYKNPRNKNNHARVDIPEDAPFDRNQPADWSTRQAMNAMDSMEPMMDMHTGNIDFGPDPMVYIHMDDVAPHQDAYVNVNMAQGPVPMPDMVEPPHHVIPGDVPVVEDIPQGINPFSDPVGLVDDLTPVENYNSEIDELPPIDLSFEDGLKPTGAWERNRGRRLKEIMTDEQFQQPAEPAPEIDMSAFNSSIELNNPFQQ